MAYKVNSVYQTFSFKSAGFLPSVVCSILGKLPVLIESLHSFCHASNFPSEMFDKLYRAISGCVLCALKVLRMDRSVFKFHMFMVLSKCWFSGAAHLERCRSFASEMPDKFQCNLQSGPLIFWLFSGQQTMLKKRVFEQCTATQGLILVRRSL